MSHRPVPGSLDAKYTTQLRILGKKIFQLRECVEGGLPGNGSGGVAWGQFLKASLYVATVLKQVGSLIPADAAVLGIVPAEKIYQNPNALPEIFGVNGSQSKSDNVQDDNQIDFGGFYERMLLFSQETVLQISEGSQPMAESTAATNSHANRPNSLPLEVSKVFKSTSAERLAA